MLVRVYLRMKLPPMLDMVKWSNDQWEDLFILLLRLMDLVLISHWDPPVAVRLHGHWSFKSVLDARRWDCAAMAFTLVVCSFANSLIDLCARIAGSYMGHVSKAGGWRIRSNPRIHGRRGGESAPMVSLPIRLGCHSLRAEAANSSGVIASHTSPKKVFHWLSWYPASFQIQRNCHRLQQHWWRREFNYIFLRSLETL